MPTSVCPLHSWSLYNTGGWNVQQIYMDFCRIACLPEIIECHSGSNKELHGKFMFDTTALNRASYLAMKIYLHSTVFRSSNFNLRTHLMFCIIFRVKACTHCQWKFRTDAYTRRLYKTSILRRVKDWVATYFLRPNSRIDLLRWPRYPHQQHSHWLTRSAVKPTLFSSYIGLNVSKEHQAPMEEHT